VGGGVREQRVLAHQPPKEAAHVRQAPRLARQRQRGATGPARGIQVPLVALGDRTGPLARPPQRPRLAPREEVAEVDAPLAPRARGEVTHLEPLEVPLRPDPQAVGVARVADRRPALAALHSTTTACGVPFPPCAGDAPLT